MNRYLLGKSGESQGISLVASIKIKPALKAKEVAICENDWLLGNTRETF